MDKISCPNCKWGDTRPSTNSRLNICPYCGGDAMIYASEDAQPQPEPAPAKAPAVADEPKPPTPPA